MSESKNLRERIKDLERELRDHAKQCELTIKEKELEWKMERNDLDTQHIQSRIQTEEALKLQVKELTGAIEKYKAITEEQEKRYSDSAYKLLSEILKALVVKLPTLDIKSLNVEAKKAKE